MAKTLIRCSVLGEHTQLRGRSVAKASRFTGGRYENTASDLTPSTVLTTRWNRCCKQSAFVLKLNDLNYLFLGILVYLGKLIGQD